MRAIANLFDRLSRGLNTVALWAAVLAVFIMIFAVGYQVVARYIFFAPPVWTEELARYGMVWAGLLGATVAFHAKADPTLFPAMQAIAGIKGLGFALVRAAGILVFTTPVLYFSIFGANQNIMRGFIMRTFDRQADALGMSMLFVTSAVPIAFGLIVIHLLADLMVRISKLGGAQK